jgi:putative ABC transport system substrate-binding protein
MQRREFITGLGGAGASAAWPLTARAQKPALPVIGYLTGVLPADDKPYLAEFLRGLGETGFVEGRNVLIEYRYAENQGERLPALAADLVARRVAVIAAIAPAPLYAMRATRTIPIVFFSGGDPVRIGLVASLNRPDGNLTGFTVLSLDLTPKRLGLLHDVVPKADIIAFLMDTALQDREKELEDLQSAGRSIGLRIVGIRVGREQDFDTAFGSIAREGAGALVVRGSSIFTTRYRGRLLALVARHGIPAIYTSRSWVDAGGLMAYSPSTTDVFRQVGVYTGRILKGEKPADLPVQSPTKFELVINMKTARTLGLTIPETLLATADELIQ